MANDYKSSFPIFNKYPGLVYLDNAATTQKPRSVIERMTDFYTEENANIHRGVYELSNRATDTYEEVRSQVATFIQAPNPETIGFTKGTTESINTVAHGFLAPRLTKGDNIVTTIMEHHANFLPWQQLAKSQQAELRVARIDREGNLDLEQWSSLINERTKMVAVTHISNTLGTINPIKTLVDRAHEKGAPVLIDAAQSVAHYPLDVETLGCDFLVFSGHKMFGPFGTGILYVHPKWIKAMHPHNLGGGMIRHVGVEESSFAAYPFNLEAGTPNVAGVAGLGEAIAFVTSLDRKKVVDHIHDLTHYATARLKDIEGIELIGSPKEQSGIVSFEVSDIHPHDVASRLNRDQIAVRAGMHCTQPLLEGLGLSATTRASFSIYNDRQDIDNLAESLVELHSFWHD
ncbi:MAG: cysteine desulfurase [Bacteroidota bacterium]